ncbi:acyl-CoA thioesterase [Lacticaseibacillus yichunensis]|uniref:Acyl-CoA thioesterase n=1 Tax=Lacticaseibacillus yichunensis TaxID=2486015 RepID=A0ABW4CRI0_9LACO|nr:acyl-CoA thioesterase [Lacticaseibacillus yichunensis]
MNFSETLATTTHRVFEGQMNEHDSLFGGQTVAWLDENASIAAHRLARRGLVTASVDHMEYVTPVAIGDAVIYQSVVSGVGTRSLEVFTKLVGEQMDSGERYLAGWSFMTFVTRTPDALPTLEFDSAFGQRLNAGYAERRARNKALRDAAPITRDDTSML